ncbi:MAG: Flp pilus assembly protein CpaB [Lentisphaeria bacterium]|nr:Flp pilus assembly protein CpaB [Lentisphaeria bacterium]
MKQKFLLLAAVFFGVMAFILTFQQIDSERDKIRSTMQEVALLQAKRDIAENEIITEDAIVVKKFQRAKSQVDSSREVQANQKSLIIGRKAMFPISKGAVLQWNDLQTTITGGREGANAMIRPGYRAVAIPVDQTASVAGLVQPNNYVDLIGTFKFPDMRGDASLDTITLTILQRVRVIATGNDYGVRAPGQGAIRSYSTVTLELLPAEAEMIVFASQKGYIQMSLRNHEDSVVTKDLQSVNWKYLQKNLQQYSRERERRSMSGRN